MLGEAPVEIGRNARVKGVIAAFDDVQIPRLRVHLSSPMNNRDANARLSLACYRRGKPYTKENHHRPRERLSRC